MGSGFGLIYKIVILKHEYCLIGFLTVEKTDVTHALLPWGCAIMNFGSHKYEFKEKVVGLQRWVVQWLVYLLLFQKTQVNFPAHVGDSEVGAESQTVCNSSPGGSSALFWPLGALHTCDTQTSLQAKNIPTHKTNKYLDCLLNNRVN